VLYSIDDAAGRSDTERTPAPKGKRQGGAAGPSWSLTAGDPAGILRGGLPTGL